LAQVAPYINVIQQNVDLIGYLIEPDY